MEEAIEEVEHDLPTPSPRRGRRNAVSLHGERQRTAISPEPPTSRSSTPETTIWCPAQEDEEDEKDEKNEAAELADAMANLEASVGRTAASPTSSISGQANSNGNGANYMSPLPAGHQQDLNFLYNHIQELSALLAKNREKTAELAKIAENVARRNQVNGDGQGEGEAQNDKARILQLERENAKKDRLIEAYKHEQRENTKLIAEYEDALGTATEQIRNFSLGIDEQFRAQTRHYNNLLQQEKDDHLASRLEKDYWFQEALKYMGQIRHATRLAVDEWSDEYKVVAGLQGEVRCMRRVLGWDPQKPEEEGGWPYLKDYPLNDQS